MPNDYTPKQVAKALRVSESSVKRWCDQGEIDFTRTFGGHRRINAGSLQKFLQKTNRCDANLEVLVGAETELPVRPDKLIITGNLVSESFDSTNQFRQRLLDALLRPDESACRALILQFFAISGSIAVLADLLIAPCFKALGEMWQRGEVRVFQERQAVTITLQILHELRRLLPPPSSEALKAIGGTLVGDDYTLPTALVESVLKESGIRACNIGSNLPCRTFIDAAQHHAPDFLWLSVSDVFNPVELELSLHQLFSELPSSVTVLIGGRALNLLHPDSFSAASRFTQMQDLASFMRQQVSLRAGLQ